MPSIVHLSDLHFGAVRSETLEPLVEITSELRPDVLVVSGDLTQRARRAQFEAAGEFLGRLACPRRVIVPGNHDVPLWNVWKRFLGPRSRFDRYITRDTYPATVDDTLAVVGLDTTRSLTVANGRVNARQLDEVARRFRGAPSAALRVLTCHHPFVLPEGLPSRKRAGRSDMALAALVEHQVDLLLTGHRHVPWVSQLGTALPTVHAGTTTSTRTRGAGNSFNEIVVEKTRVTVRRFCWRPDQERFVLEPGALHEMGRDENGRVAWTRPRTPVELEES